MKSTSLLHKASRVKSRAQTGTWPEGNQHANQQWLNSVKLSIAEHSGQYYDWLIAPCSNFSDS